VRIAFIVSDLLEGFQQSLWAGVQKAARDLHVQCLTLPGGFFFTKNENQQPHNILYDFLEGEQIDGFIISSSIYSSENSMAEIQAFCQKYKGTPFVSIGLKLENAPAVLVDNSTGLNEIISHYIEEHGYRELGFIQGPLANAEAKTRYETFQKALKDHGIKEDSQWVREGNFLKESGYACMKQIWSSPRKPRAVFAANDQMILGAFEYLMEQGVEVPETVALGGFDNLMESRFNKVPLTTVEQPVQHQVYKAVELLKRYITDGTPPKDSILKTKAVYRESCGCFSNNIMQSGEKIGSEDIPLGQESPVKDILKSILFEKHGIDFNMFRSRSQLKDILEYTELFLEEPDKKTQDSFLRMMSKILSRDDVDENVLQEWNTVLTALEQSYTYVDIEKSKIIQPLLQKFYIMISERMEQILSSRAHQQTQEFIQMQDSLQRLMEAYDMETLLSRLSTELQGVGLNSFYLTFFEGDPQSFQQLDGKLPGRSILHLNYREGKSHMVNKAPFPTKDILPLDLFQNEQSYALLCQVIFADHKLVGLMICNSEGQSGNFFESLRSQLSSSIRAGQLMEEMKQNQIFLRNRNEAIQNQLAPMLKAIEEVSRITGEKIDVIEKTAIEIKNSRGTFTETTQSVDEIASNARYMMDLIKTIDDISERINVLSFNASIESARAGQHGKGFGVIAGEVRKLADSTARNASQTSSTLKQVIQSISQSKDSSEKSLKTYTSIEGEMNALSSSLAEIQNRMNELSQFSQQIMSIIHE